MTFTPGQVLAPLNTLIEQFSDVMLIAMIAFGVEKMLLSVGASRGVSFDLLGTCSRLGSLLLARLEPPVSA